MSRNCSTPGTSWSPIWRSRRRRYQPVGGPTRSAPPARASRRPSASCDAPPRKDARASRHRIAATGLGAAVAGHRPPRVPPKISRRGSRGRTEPPPSPTPRPQPAHGAPSRRRGHTREHAPHSRPHRHGWHQWSAHARGSPPPLEGGPPEAMRGPPPRFVPPPRATRPRVRAGAGHRPSVRRGSRLGRTDEPSRDRGTRGDGAGRRGRQDSCCCTRVWLRQAGDGMTTHTQCRRCRRRACRDRRGARSAQGRSHAGALPRR